MNTQITRLQETIAPLRQQIIDHKVYKQITGINELAVFMNHHIYAVWDFMSLLKALQQTLTCTTVPWFPVGSANTRYLINEIVAGEESDTDEAGNRKSHYEMYLEAMQQCNAEPAVFLDFISSLKSGMAVPDALNVPGIAGSIKDFVNYTFSIIAGAKPHVQAAVFTFGREDLIPNMFLSMVNDLDGKFPGQVSLFKYYLDRHIEVDGGHHSHLALEMTSELCGDDPVKWEEVTTASVTALQKRIGLWDGVYSGIVNAGELAVH